jgi:membrane-bound lytic murein transglycosylase MltF
MSPALLLAHLLVIGSRLGTGASPAPASEPQAGPPEAVARVMQPWQGDYDAMAKRRMIRVLVSYARATYFIDRGRQYGMTYEAFKAFQDHVNRNLGKPTLKIEVVFIPVRRDQLLPFLLAGNGDIAAANLTITDRREEIVDFCDPVLTGVSEVLVTGPAASPPPATLDDLAGREIVVRRSSSYFDSLGKLNASFRAAGRPEILLTPADESLEDEDILEMVDAGMLPMTVVDSHLAKPWAKAFGRLRVHEQLAVRSGGEIAWAVRKNSPRLVQVLNEFVRTHRKGTTFGNIIFNRYLREGKPLLNPASPGELRRVEQTLALFQKYGKQYDFDWLLVAAQGYQESRLDQSLRSPAGAVGVMQLLPRTAAGPPIGIRDIEQLENNVHAGVAYLRHLRQQYFSDPKLDDFNQQLFAFAAYNAGPGRVSGLRKKAAAMGLDPNRWFHNVEIVAAREIGRETVDYVAHILKYYVAYQRVTALTRQKAAARLDSVGR